MNSTRTPDGRPLSPSRTWLPFAFVALIGALVPLAMSTGFGLRLATLVCIFAMLSMGFNLLYGYMGQITMGQQGYFAVAAYSFTLLQTRAGLPMWAALLGSLLINALTALIIGIPLLRLRTHYLAMATLAFSLVVAGVANRWSDLTGGVGGLAVPTLIVGDSPISRTQMYYGILAAMLILLAVQNFIVGGHIGRALKAIRDDEKAAMSLGVNATVTKMRMFVLSSVFAGIAGIAYAVLNRQISPSMAEFPILVSLLTIAVVGGLGTRYGPILGSVVVVWAPQFLTQFGELETLVYGVSLLLFLVFIPSGLAGLLERSSPALSRRRRKADPYASVSTLVAKPPTRPHVSASAPMSQLEQQDVSR